MLEDIATLHRAAFRTTMNCLEQHEFWFSKNFSF